MKWYAVLGIILIVMVSVVGCSTEEETEVGGYIDVSPSEAKELIDNNPDLIIIDVSPYYADGHLPGAVSYYLGDGDIIAEGKYPLNSTPSLLTITRIFSASKANLLSS